jgi:hypothetical protein
MSSDGAEPMDAVDLWLKLAVFVCFVVFGICVWFIKRQRDKEKSGGDDGATPPKISDR